MKAEIEKRFDDVQVELIDGSGGVFEVAVNDDLVFSKKQTGRFPEPEEIFEKLES